MNSVPEHKHKLKMLYILQYLEETSDEEHPVDAKELSAHLEKNGIYVERKSIYADISAMREFGIEILNTRKPKRGYFLAQRKFQLPEVRLLMDAVQSACFITPKKSRELVQKLGSFVSKHQADRLKNQVYIDNRRKQNNEEIYYNIDNINLAIEEGKKITFKYIKNGFMSDGKMDKNEKTLTISPYALLWSDDRYYVIGNNSKYDNLIHIRLDRMRKVIVTNQSIRPYTEITDYKTGFDVADYARHIFNAFGGEKDVMELLCEGRALNAVMDVFGEDINIHPKPDGRFSFRMEVTISEGLVADILKLGSMVQVTAPLKLREMIKESVGDIYDLYR